MSQSYQHGILSNFSNEYAGRDKPRVQGFNNFPNLLVPELQGGQDQDRPIQSIYESPPPPPPAAGNMLSEMFNYSSASSDVLLASQVPVSFRQRPTGNNIGGFSGGGGGGGGVETWYGIMNNSSSLSSIDEHPTQHVFLMKGSPPSAHDHLQNHDSTFPMVSFGEASYSSGGVVEGQGLSLTLAGDNHRAPIGLMNVLRGSKYARPAKELLEEFCSVGRGKLKSSGRNRVGHGSFSNPNPNSSACSSSSSKDVVVPPLSPADRFEHQRKKAKLLSMLDEVDRRYNHYCDQMQMVVNSFDAVMGYGSATPYTELAQKAMSRHFRCLKDAVSVQLKQTCELLGDKSAAGGGSGITIGETPRLKLLDQSLRRQRAFHHLGMMEQEAWRPQRGLPERSVNVLRAWLFEHFLHPYPSDADKHLLARQTGLSRNQVSNWFINARVRLWKPMVEEMYQQEAKEECDDKERSIEGRQQRAQSPTQQQQQQNTEKPETNAPESDISSHSQGPTSISIHQHHHQHHHHHRSSSDDVIFAAPELDMHGVPGDDMFRFAAVYGGVANALVTGDVSLTLGLRHAGNGSSAKPENNRFPLRDCGG
ncbi:putative transcription factor Homeodomain-TALE-BEL family [Dioscorea sansibarensis]